MIESITLGNFKRETVLSKDCRRLSLPEGADVGSMTLYTVFPGITVMYNDFHTDRYTTQFSYATQMISIDHCREGRIEWARSDGRFSYLGERDLLLSADATHMGTYGFPTGHYHGITIQFELDEARDSLRPFQETFSIDLDQIYRRFCQQGDDLILRGDDGIEHLFAELYVVQGSMRMSYLRLKVLELLLYLSRLDMTTSPQIHSYFRRALVEKVRCIRQELSDNPIDYVSLSDLAARYEVSESALKRCFRAMYGDSIYSFLKKHRLETSQTLLRSTDWNIADVAAEVGYENTSKYIAAFKKQFGITPAKYRSSHSTK